MNDLEETDVDELLGSPDSGEDFFESAKSETQVESEEVTAIQEPDVPQLMGTEFPKDYVEMVTRLQFQYSNLPHLNYDEIYSEFAELSIKSSPTPSLPVLNDEMQKVQSAKDRLSEIYIDVIKSHNFKKRAVDILTDSWGRFSEEKSADKRKGDGIFRLSNFLSDFAMTESLLKATTHILKNLDSLHDNLSRRITIFQLTMKLNDVGRGALPEFDYHGSSGNDKNDVNTNVDSSEGQAPTEESF